MITSELKSGDRWKSRYRIVEILEVREDGSDFPDVIFLNIVNKQRIKNCATASAA